MSSIPEDLRSLDEMSLLERAAIMPDGPDRDDLLMLILSMDANDPDLVLRPDQLSVVRGKSWIELMLSGRGAGKTFAGAHWVIERAKTPNTTFSLVGRTVADVRDVMVQGDSGILAVSPTDFQPNYMPSLRKLIWPNGSEAITYSSDVPSQLRGPQSHYTWLDELAAYRMVPDDSGASVWDNAVISTRLGENPQILVTTTPKRTPLIRELDRQAKTDKRLRVTTVSTLANRANLSPAYLEALFELYAGTHLERQELYGELIGDAAGALLRGEDIIVDPDIPDREDMLVIIGVDPAVEANRDDTGIVVIMSTTERELHSRRAWVIDDLTTNGGPDEWAQIVVDLQEKWSTPRSTAIVVAEGNQGGQLISMVLKQINPVCPVAIVKASVGKEQRAEPITVAYRRKRVKHYREFPELVEEWTGWEPKVSRWSPGHLDACVWALHTALIDDKALRPFAPINVLSDGRRGDLLPSAVPPWRQGQGRVTGVGLAVPAWRSRAR